LKAHISQAARNQKLKKWGGNKKIDMLGSIGKQSRESSRRRRKRRKIRKKRLRREGIAKKRF